MERKFAEECEDEQAPDELIEINHTAIPNFTTRTSELLFPRRDSNNSLGSAPPIHPKIGNDSIEVLERKDQFTVKSKFARKTMKSEKHFMRELKVGHAD